MDSSGFIIFSCICLIAVTDLISAVEQDCPPLYAPKNGRIISLSYTTKQFMCEEHYVLYGSPELECLNGKWSDRQPICRLKQNSCGDPGTPVNGLRLGRKFTIGFSVRYRCKTNFILIGVDRRRCLDNQQWSDSLPVCKAKNNISVIANTIRNNLIDKYNNLTESSRFRGHFGDGKTKAIGLDIVIVLDKSSSIDPLDFKKCIDFTKSLIEEFGISPPNTPGGTRVAAVTFGDTSQVEFNLNDPEIFSLESLFHKLDTIIASGGATNIEAAFLNIISEIIPKTRHSSKKIIFMTSDGKSNKGGSPEQVASILKTKFGFEIFTFGVGPDVDHAQLTQIASIPFYTHVYQLQNFYDLDELTKFISETSFKAPEYYKCGVSYVASLTQEEANIMGAEVTPGSWPWLTVMHIENIQTAGVTFYCGAVLICDSWVLTAAHCLKLRNSTLAAKKVSLTVGEHNLIIWENKELNVGIEQIIIHPEYDASSFENDIALLKLIAPVTFSRYIRPVCLPPKDFKDLTQISDTRTWIVGWGATQERNVWEDVTPRYLVPYQLVMNITNSKICKKYLRTSRKFKSQSDNIFCAGKSFGAPPACTGDSGGPLVLKHLNRFYLAGIVSWGDDCVKFGKYSVFTKVSNYLNWISNITQKCNTYHL